MGNPNSLGAVAGILAPILLWGALLGGETFVRHRRSLLYCVCMYLAVQSQARAGWFAALMSCGLLCLALRKYRLMMVGAILVVSMVATAGILAPLTLSSVTNFAIFKGGNKDEGLFASRKGPWQTALDNIQQHPWLGMGLGTTMNAVDPNVQQGLYASSSDVTAENGSSYLAILAGLGIVGAIPMFLLLILLVRKILQTTTWLRTFNSPWHPAVPSAMIVVAGLVHASFEDWLFAPGNYLCIFFWSAAFLLIDLAPREFNVFSRRNLR